MNFNFRITRSRVKKNLIILHHLKIFGKSAIKKQPQSAETSATKLIYVNLMRDKIIINFKPVLNKITKKRNMYFFNKTDII